MTLPVPRAELAAAVRAVNAAYNRLSAEVQQSVDVGATNSLEAEDAAILAGDRPRAVAAIAAWRRRWLATFEEAGR